MNKNNFYMDPKERFSSRVENYIKYRPVYPSDIIEFLTNKMILSKDSIIADIGSGTGILSQLFLENGNIVYGIEPNSEMRDAAENILKNYKKFISIDGSAENARLKNNSVDLITAGQAFHWFDVIKAKKEFTRILKSSGYVVLIWNLRKKTMSGFHMDYEQFVLKYGKDYKEIIKREKNLNLFFEYERETFYNSQLFTFDAFLGRVLSSSYIPLAHEPNFDEMMIEVKVLFEKYQEKGLIKLEYDTVVCYGIIPRNY
jgi:ubiquinone/menaquinone biosynthesis C-methylase UbiE